MEILDGKKTAQILKNQIAAEVAQLVTHGIKRPHLAAILAGSDGASQTYVGHKEKDCREAGIESTVIRFADTVSETELLQTIEEINQNADIDGLIVQLPLPKHIDEQKIIEAIDPAKDVDGFHPLNVGKMMLGLPAFVSATPDGIMELIKHYRIETKGKHCVVLGRSNIVGRPIANLLLQKGYPGDCTLTVCHSRTPNIRKICLQADILIAALGVPSFVKANMVKE